MAQLVLNLLGYPEVKIDNHPITEKLASYQKAFALLVYLAVTGQPHGRLHLAELLWPELDERKGLAYFRGRAGLTPLRALLKDFLVISPSMIAFQRKSDFVLDVEQFQNQLHIQSRLDQLEAAVALYRGEFCKGFMPKDVSVEYELWLLRWRERLRDLQMTALMQLVTRYARWRQYERAIYYAEQLLEIDPWLEKTYRWLMRLHTWQGQPDRALTHYELCRRLLKEELGVEPAAETEDLRQQIGADALPPPVQVPFLAPAPPPHYVGRKQALNGIIQESHQRSIIALVGMGGIGKSTLARQVAHRVRYSFPDGVLWAQPNLSPAEDVLLTWAQFYDYDLSGLTTLSALRAAWRGITEDRRILIVLDGVIAAEEARPLLPHSANCVVLITTRSHDVATSLNARRLEMACFDTNTGRQLLAAILGQRVVDEVPGTVTEICRLLEGLPLALEILAQRLRTRPQQTLQSMLIELHRIRSRLDLLQLEDRAVRTSFELSWELLAVPLQQLYSVLSLFAGRPFHTEAAVAMLNEPHVAWQLADLATLSLLQSKGEGYWRQHTLLAEFAAEKLTSMDLNQGLFNHRLAVYYRDFIEHHAQDFPRLRREWGNLLAVMTTAHARRHWQLVFDLGSLLTHAWFVRARYSEARQAYRLSYDAARMLEDDRAVAETLLHWGRACVEQCDYEEAKQHLDESLYVFRNHLTDSVGEAEVQLVRGRLALELTHFAEAEEALLRAQETFFESGSVRKTALALYRRARLAFFTSDYTTAHELGETALTDLPIDSQVQVLNLLADIHMAQGDLDAAEARLDRALELCAQTHDKANRAVVEGKFGRLLIKRGSLTEAHRYRVRSLEQFRQMGDRKSEAYALYDLSLIAELQDEFNRGLQLADQSLSIFDQLDDTFNIMNTLLHKGDLLWAQQKTEEAIASWQRSLAFADSLDNKRFTTVLQERLIKAHA